MVHNPFHNKIQSQSPVLLEDLIELVLYDPDYGYYANSKVIGKQQDFITAPELTPLFSQCLAQWCVDQWVNAGKPFPVNLIELGAGRGIMLKDMLAALKTVPEFFKVITPVILERSPTLIKIQQQTLHNYSHVQWIDSLDSTPDGYSIILANEFFDALPIQYYRYKEGQLEEAIVTDLKSITWRPAPPHSMLDTPKTTAKASTAGPDKNCLFMRSRFYEKFSQQIANLLNRFGGLGLIIDYGGSSPGFTLQAIKNHRKVGIFDHLGHADITHHVDFSYLKSLFQKHGLNVLGPQNQSGFLHELGISAMINSLATRLSAKAYAQHTLAVHRLLSAGEMGELFKVLAIQGGHNGC